MTLYEIDGKLRQLLDAMYMSVSEDGSIDDSAIDFKQLNELKEERQTKLENITLYIKECEAEAKALKEEYDKLKQRADTATRKADSLRKYLTDSLINNGETDGFSTARCKVSFRKSESVEVPDIEYLDNKFKIENISYSPDKKAIKAAIKSGEDVCGAFLKENYNIQIN